MRKLTKTAVVGTKFGGSVTLERAYENILVWYRKLDHLREEIGIFGGLVPAALTDPTLKKKKKKGARIGRHRPQRHRIIIS